MAQQVFSVKEIEETFQVLDTWEDRYSYVIDLGRKLPPFPTEEMTEANLVRGCTSQVWLISQNPDPKTVDFLADSDAHIVKGLIAILMAAYKGQPKDHVHQYDIENLFNRLGLGEHLSPNRRNGFFAMVHRIKALAE
jgi:cysteine desulfuration protein SufE